MYSTHLLVLMCFVECPETNYLANSSVVCLLLLPFRSMVGVSDIPGNVGGHTPEETGALTDNIAASCALCISV